VNKFDLLNGVFNKVANANNELLQIWVSQIVFSWRWWLGVLLTIFPWIIWVRIRDKKNTIRLLFVGIIVILVTDSLDVIGMSFHLWHYDWTVLPFIPEFIPWDYTMFPVGIMLILQLKPKVNAFIKTIAFAFLSAFIIEPLFNWLGLYDMVHWKYWYSFVIYLALFLIFNWIYKSRLLNIKSNT
jgi:hypothetical protein